MAARPQPLHQSFPAFVQTLYRHWYGLPRKSTQAWLETARHELADAVREEEPVEAIRAFVDSAATRPGVADEAAVELGAVQRALQTSFLAVFDPENVDALGMLLTIDAPVDYAFGQWIYVSARATETLDNVRGCLDDAMNRLPPSTTREIETIFANIDALDVPASSYAPTAGAHLEAVRQALTLLEAMPAVLRIAWRELLAGKAATERKTLGIARQAKGAARPAPDASAHLEMAVAAPQSIRFHTDVDFPSQVRPSVEIPLTVRLALQLPDSSRVDEVLDVEFADPAKPEMIDVVLDAPGFSERFDLWHRTMLVFADRDSEPVTFLLTADALERTERGASQMRTIKVSFYHAGKHIGQGALEVQIGGDARARAGKAKSATEDNSIELRLVNLPAPADLELRVSHDPANQELHFMLHSTKSEVGYHWRRMGKVQLLEGKPQLFFERQLTRLNEWSGLLPDELYTDEETEFTRKMENMGESLFEMLFSPELQDAYWRDILPKQQSGAIRSLLITSDEPWIPWEMVKPYQYDEVTDEEHEGDFLAASFEISRWLTGHGPYERVAVDRAGIVAPDVSLAHVKSETEHLTKLAEHGVVVQADLQTRAEVIDLVQEGETRLLHVASHAQFDAEHPDASPLMLYDADLLPEDLDRRVIRRWRKAQPLVFFNACEAGRIEYKLTGLGGWADKFIRDVRATAFLGTLWQVNDALAAEFAMVFYDELLAGETLGVACQRARLHIKELAPANPTWLAYTLYGDPNTVVTWG